MQCPQVPAENNQGTDALDAEVDEKIDDVVRALRCAVDARVGLDCSFASREQATLSIGNEAQRRLLEQELQSIAEAQGRELLINEAYYREHRPGSRDYASLCGPLRIQRSTYRLAGVRNGPTAVPLDLQAGLMEGATPAMAYRVALGYAKVHSRSLEEDLRASHRVPPSRTTLEKMSKRFGAKSKQEARRIEAYLRQSERLPDGAAGISVGLDRAAVPMEEGRADDAVPKSRRKKRIKPYVRIPPAPVDVNYRMAYVGTVSITDQYGDGLVTRRYAASPDEGPDEVLHGMMADVRNALRRNASLRVGLVQDGAPEMWKLLRSALTQAGVTNWLEAIDRYHLNERLAKVLKIIEPNSEARKPQLHRWNDELDTDDSTIDRIEERVGREIGHRNGIDDLTVLQDNATFIGNNKDRMRYVSLREASLPVGSGATEGACRYVIGERTKRASRRWHDEGLAAALALRSIYCSDRLPRFFTYLQRNYAAEIREADWQEYTAA
jgi:hypothetical protein